MTHYRRFVGLTLVILALFIPSKHFQVSYAANKTLAINTFTGRAAMNQETSAATSADIKKKLSKYALVPLRADVTTLPANERQALQQLIIAAQAIDDIYWKQRSADGLNLRTKLRQSKSLTDRDLLHYLSINYGPYDKSENDKPFLAVRPQLPGATFYPEDLTKDEFERYVTANPTIKEDFYKINTIIRREQDKLVAVPFETVYRPELEKASQALKQASQLTKDPAMKKYLELRAAALLSGNFRESDFSWIDVRDGLLDIVIGPIEVYDDSLVGLKASYEGTVLVRDRVASNKLKVFEEQMQHLQRNLPVPPDLQPQEVPTSTPIGIFQVAYVAVAASLPNDEVVIKEKGAKKLFYKNIMLAKFQKNLLPIAKQMIEPSLLPLVTEEAFFNNVLGHELAHTLGLKFVRQNNKDTDIGIRLALKETYSTIEEAKADIVGIYAVNYFTNKGILSELQERQSYVTYLAGTFRSIRFGSEEDHARGNIIQFNFLRQRGAITYNEKAGLYNLDLTQFRGAVKALAELLLTVEGNGDYPAAKQIIERYGRLDATTEENLKRLAAIPVDIEFSQSATVTKSRK
jgi:hypothetical protein